MRPIVHVIQLVKEVQRDDVADPLCFGDLLKGNLAGVPKFAYSPVGRNLTFCELISPTQKT